MSEEVKNNEFTFENPAYRQTYWHTCSHVMAQAVKRLWPEVKLAIGPSIDEGWYYDLDAPFAFTPEHLEQIEAEMRKICKEKLKLERFELPREEAVKFMEEKGEPFKVELIQHLEERAPHVVQVLKPDRGGKAEHGVLPILKDGDTPVPLQPVQHPAGVLAGEAGGNGAGRLIHPRHSGPAGAEVLQPGLQVPGQAGHPGPVTRGGSGPGQIHPPHSLVSIGVLTTYSR